MPASTAEPGPRIFTAYFASLVGPEGGAGFVRDLRAWAVGGPFRLLVVADEALVGVSNVVRERVASALGERSLAGVVERIAIAGAGRQCSAAVPVRHFGADWHGAQAWLRAPSPRSDA